MKPKLTNNNSQYQPAEGEILQLFPVHMFRGYCPLDREVIANDVRNIVAEIQEKDPDNVDQNYTSYFYQEAREKTHQLPWFTDFANLLKDSYVEFVRTQYHNDVSYLTRHDIHLCAWVNRYEGNHEHEVHNHVNSLVSGTYYVKTKDTQPIKFFNPNMTGDFAVRPAVNSVIDLGIPNTKFWGTSGTQADVQITPQEGEFLLWPSYMMHCVPRASFDQRDNYERISISFNLIHNEELSDTNHGTQMSYGFLK